jgi:hypothetical protein
MSGPVAAQEVKSSLRQRDVAILAAFATTDMNHHPRAIDICDAKVSAFLKSQAAGVDGRQTDSIARQTNQGENTADFIEGEDCGEFLLRGGTDEVEDSPLLIEGLLEEELDAAKSDGAG